MDPGTYGTVATGGSPPPILSMSEEVEKADPILNANNKIGQKKEKRKKNIVSCACADLYTVNNTQTDGWHDNKPSMFN